MLGKRAEVGSSLWFIWSSVNLHECGCKSFSFLPSTPRYFLILSLQTPNGDIMKHKSSCFERHTSFTSSNFLAFLDESTLLFLARVLKLIGKLSPRCFGRSFSSFRSKSVQNNPPNKINKASLWKFYTEEKKSLDALH